MLEKVQACSLLWHRWQYDSSASRVHLEVLDELAGLVAQRAVEDDAPAALHQQQLVEALRGAMQHWTSDMLAGLGVWESDIAT